MFNQKNKTVTRGRGSVMLAVVVMLVMLALIGTAYIQLARYDRIASVAGIENNIDVVAGAAMVYIGEVLRNDLVNESSVMFDGTTDEPYDYPWTNDNDPANIKYPIELYDESTNSYYLTNATGGFLDDTWLASSEPTWGSTPVWPHITNLNGYFLKIPKIGAGKTVPVERAVDYTLSGPYWHMDKDVPFTGASNGTYLDDDESGNYEELGADADGDGILDSKWTWAPIRQISGVSYIMAVRIIDNSGMVNANTALGQVTAADTFDSYHDAPRWLFPSELDFSNFYYKVNASAPTNDLLDFYTTRFGASVSSPRIGWITDSISRYNFWHQAARRWSNYTAGYASWTTTDEMELRYRNGLNNADQTASIEKNTVGLDTLLRQSSSAENTWEDWDGPTASTMQTFFESEPRHQITTRNGASIYAMRLDDVSANVTFNGTTYTPAQFNDVAFLLKQDINQYIPLSTDSAVQKLAKKDALALEVYKVLGRGAAFEGMTDNEIQTYSNQFVANFMDHVDADNWMNTYRTQNGLELWPAITEVYTQRPVAVSSLGSMASTNNFWPASGNPTGTTGYAFELFNPHTQPIPIADIFIDMTYVDTSNVPRTVKFTASGRLTDIIQTAVRNANHGDEWLYPEQKIILYHDSTGGSTSTKTSALIRDRDSVLGYVFNKIEGSVMDKRYSEYTNGTSYSVGDLVYVEDTTLPLPYVHEVYECIQAHTGSASRAPNESTTYVSNHDYWRRKIIVVDAGPWLIPDSFDTSKPIKLNLYAATQDSGETGSTTAVDFPYQSTTVKAWRPSQSLSKTVFYDTYPDWVAASNYAVDAEVRSTVDFMIYRCTTADNASGADPSANANWTLADDENMFYVQATAIGSTDGLEAFAHADSDWVRYDTMDSTYATVAPHSAYFAQIGKPDKTTKPNTWNQNQGYSVNSLVFDGSSKYFACMIAHTSGTTTIADDSDNWVQIPGVGKSNPSTGIRGSGDQFLHTNMRAPHYAWQVDREYFVGDVVRKQNDDTTYICLSQHYASSLNQPPGANWAEHWRSMTDGYPIANLAELMQIVIAGPSDLTTLPDILGNTSFISSTGHLSDLMLPMETTVVAGSNSMAVPHALALMDRLTIHRPNTDLLDNDGDSETDEEDELLVPGTVNINTAPTHLLEKILPVPSSSNRTSIANAIKNYREGAGRGTNWRTNKGFASSSELYRALVASGATILDATSGDTYLNAGVYVDFENKDQWVADGISDDREESLMFARHLMGVASARSDFFTAYILIRGYPTGNFTRGPVESKQVIAVFDRSNMADGASVPRIIGVYEFD